MSKAVQRKRVKTKVMSRKNAAKTNVKASSELTKRERLEARVSTTQKRLISKAASLQGRSISDFVVETLNREAKKIVHDFEALEFSIAEKAEFIAALENPPAPNSDLINLFKRF